MKIADKDMTVIVWIMMDDTLCLFVDIAGWLAIFGSPWYGDNSILKLLVG